MAGVKSPISGHEVIKFKTDIFFKMLNVSKKKFVLAICQFIFLHVLGQQNLNDIQTAFRQYSNGLLTEKVFTHTDKNFYLAGEIIWFKLYVVNGDDINKPMDLSNVAHVEVFDKDKKSVL